MKKKISIILIILFIVILFVVCFFLTPKTEDEPSGDILTRAQEESSAILESERKDFEEVNVSSYLEKYRSDELNIVLIGRTTCPYCQIAEPILQKISKEYNLTIFYLNTDYVTQDEKESLLSSDEFFNSSFGTPLLMIVGKEEIVDTLEGLADYDQYISFLKKNEFIKGKQKYE